MCTVSYVYSQGKVIITSNRDEKTERPSSVHPLTYTLNGKKITFPKDPKAGGTWFAVDENANVVVLLNGAEQKHISKSSYARSRGLVLLDIISSKSPFEAWMRISLKNIEPFTLILFQDEILFQLRWNEAGKEIIPLSDKKNNIWSSATLYSAEVIAEREKWFHDFAIGKTMITENDMHYFHMHTDSGNAENGLVMNRNNMVKTFSITQAVIEKNKVSMFHYDLQNEEAHAESFLIV
jgi:hypothetical protein